MKLEGHLYQQKYRDKKTGKIKVNGPWYWNYKGKRHKTRQRTLAGARAWVHSTLELLRVGQFDRAIESPLTWAEVEPMLKTRWTVEGKTRMLASGLGYLNRLRPTFGHLPVEAITPSIVADYKLARLDAGAAPNSVNQELRVLRRGFSLAYEDRKITMIPKFTRCPKARSRKGIVEPMQLAGIVQHIGAMYVPPINLLYRFGWRESEALKLSWDRVEIGPLQVTIELWSGTTKTGERRMVTADSKHPIYALLVAQQGKHPKLVFPGLRGRISKSGLQRAWRAACIEAGIEDANTPHGSRMFIHDLRRTAVRDMRKAGVPREVAMNIVGHNCTAIHDEYSVVNEQDKAQGLALLEQARVAVGGTDPFATLSLVPPRKPLRLVGRKG